MNIIKLHVSALLTRSIMNVLITFLLTLFATTSLSAQERQVYVDPAVYYEMVRVEVVNIGEDGSGTLRINQHDCGGCTEDVFFNEDSILESPLGSYRGLSKLPNWTDKEVLVVVGKQDGVVRRVTVD